MLNLNMRGAMQQESGGFSMMELTIVLMVLSVVLAGLLPMITESTQSDQADTTLSRLEAIEEALRTFTAHHHRLPCPSDMTALDNEAEFGREATSVGGIPCSSNTPKANWNAGETSGGMVPVKTLHLPDEYAFDGWGRRIAYHVDRRLTDMGMFHNAISGSIRVLDASGSERTSDTEKAAYLILSHGPNGHGAFLKSGVRFGSGSANSHELENCDCTGDGGDASYNDVFYQHMGGMQVPGDKRTLFDDLVRYKMRPQLN